MKHEHTQPDIMGEALGRVKLPEPRERARIIEMPLTGAAARRDLANKLNELGLTGMAHALSQLGEADLAGPGFEERLARLVERELAERAEKRWREQMSEAGLPYGADLSQVDWRPNRGLVRPLLKSLAGGSWIGQGAGLIITGPTGVGKTFVACAIAGEALRQGFGVLYRRLDDLLWELAAAREKGQGPGPDRRLLKADLLILDNWGLAKLTAAQAAGLSALLERRWGMGSHLVVSQRPVERWAGLFPCPETAAPLLDRLTGDSYQVRMSGRSLRSHYGAGPAITLDAG